MANTHKMAGKASFDHVYDREDPREYFKTLRRLEYQIPHHAQRVFLTLLDAKRDARPRDALTVTDLCCSYGINAALLKYPLTLEALYERYDSPAVDHLSSGELASVDRAFFSERLLPESPKVIGVDAATHAVRYALATGVLDGGGGENLEQAEPSEQLAKAVETTDLVTVTGGIGYIGPSTLDRVLTSVAAGRRPWVAAFALRSVSYEPIAAALRRHGLVTEQLPDRTFVQRRFADASERAGALRALAGCGLDPAGKESEGYFHAVFYVSRPPEEVEARPVAELLSTE